MHPYIVLPCLNEAAGLHRACASLGFGLSARGCSDAVLVLVDNGSTDGTADVMRDIASKSPGGSVLPIAEADRGYVPARHAGTLCAAAHAADRGIAPEATLILQADADTCYLAGYVARMTEASERWGPGRIYLGHSVPPSMSDDCCGAFRGLEASIDSGLSYLTTADENDVVIDDKVAGFTVADYRLWGGHTRSFSIEGDEIFAETTRLFIRGRLLGACRYDVGNALAVTSQRRILANPALALATAGFPRDPRWVERWLSAYVGPVGLDAFSVDADPLPVRQAVCERTRHMIGLFGILPAYMAVLTGEATGPLQSATPLGNLLATLPIPSREISLANPGRLLIQAMSLTCAQIDALLELRDQAGRDS